MMRMLCSLVLLALAAPAAAQQVDTAGALSPRQLRQRLGFSIAQLQNDSTATMAALAHLRISWNAAHAIVVRDSLRAVTPLPPAPPQPPATDTTPAPLPPPPGDAAVLWSTDWPVLGNTPTVVQNGFHRYFCRFDDVMEIVPGASLGWPATPNVARITIAPETTHCRGVEVTVPGLSSGQSYYVRMYAHVDSVAPGGSTTLHPVSIVHAGNIQAVFWSIRDQGPSGYRPVFQTDFAAAGFDGTCDLRWGPPALLPLRTWHRFEWHVEFVNVRANDADVRIWPRVFDLAGNPVADAETYRRAPGWCGSATETLAQFYARGGLLRLDDLSLTNRFGVGFEGKPNVQAGSRWYYAAPAVGVGGWLGAR